MVAIADDQRAVGALRDDQMDAVGIVARLFGEPDFAVATRAQV